MAKDDSRSGRQPFDRGHYKIALALVGQEPDARQ
jgi:hypothetical protein